MVRRDGPGMTNAATILVALGGGVVGIGACTYNGTHAISFSPVPQAEIGSRVTRLFDPADPRVVITFGCVASLDVLIDNLQSIRATMTGELPKQ